MDNICYMVFIEIEDRNVHNIARACEYLDSDPRIEDWTIAHRLRFYTLTVTGNVEDTDVIVGEILARCGEYVNPDATTSFPVHQIRV